MISYLNADLCKMFKTRGCNTLDNLTKLTPNLKTIFIIVTVT